MKWWKLLNFELKRFGLFINKFDLIYKKNIYIIEYLDIDISYILYLNIFKMLLNWFVVCYYGFLIFGKN